MINKIYDKLKRIIKENYIFIISYIIILFLGFYKLPYYVYTGGGTIDVSKRISIENAYSESGKINMAYVSERRANIPLYLIALINDKWDLEKVSNYKLNLNEDYNDLLFRSKIELDIANSNALYNAYILAGRDISVKSKNIYAYYLTEQSNTNLNIGDIILRVNGREVIDLNTIKEIVDSTNTGDKVIITVLENKKEVDKYAIVYEDNGSKFIGVSIAILNQYETDPKISFKFSDSEGGPSGGMMLALSIYNKLTSDDITKGLNIVGTGTIDEIGNIGTIGGVKYKLAGAVKDRADIFIAPTGENYLECVKLKEKYKYDIEIIEGISLQQIIDVLSNK